jgi:hypothetical protein
MMKLKLMAAVATGALVFAGVAQAAGLFEGSSPQSKLMQREKAMVRALHQGANDSVRRAPRGPKGPRGPRGPQGVAGPAGAFSKITTVQGPSRLLGQAPSAASIALSTASCPPGYQVIGGGWQGGGISATVSYNAPGGGSWSVIMTNNDEVTAVIFNAVAVCAMP